MRPIIRPELLASVQFILLQGRQGTAATTARYGASERMAVYWQTSLTAPGSPGGLGEHESESLAVFYTTVSPGEAPLGPGPRTVHGSSRERGPLSHQTIAWERGRPGDRPRTGLPRTLRVIAQARGCV